MISYTKLTSTAHKSVVININGILPATRMFNYKDLKWNTNGQNEKPAKCLFNCTMLHLKTVTWAQQN